MSLNPVFIRVSTVNVSPTYAIENYNGGIDLDFVLDFRFCLSANSSSAFPKYPKNQNWPYDIIAIFPQKWFLKLPEVSWDFLWNDFSQIPIKDLGHQSRNFEGNNLTFFILSKTRSQWWRGCFWNILNMSQDGRDPLLSGSYVLTIYCHDAMIHSNDISLILLLIIPFIPFVSWCH